MPRVGKLGNTAGEDIAVTPPEILERLLRVSATGTIFDPCPHPWAGDADGTLGDWPVALRQLAYINAPFSLLEAFSREVVRHSRSGIDTCALVPVRTSQPSWRLLVREQGPVLVAFWCGDKDEGGSLPRRVRFMDKDGKRQAGAPFDTALILSSTDLGVRARFVQEFAAVATVIRAGRAW